MAILITDDFTGSDGTGWNATTWPVQRDVQVSGSPTPDIQANSGRMYTAAADCRFICATAPTLADVDVTVAWTPVTTGDLETYYEICYRVAAGVTTGTPTDGYAMQIAYKPVGVGDGLSSVRLYTINDYTYFVQVYNVGLGDVDLATGGYWFRVRVRDTRHRVKWWPIGDTEPNIWKIDVVDTTHTAAGRVFLGVYNNAAHPATETRWDSFRLEEIVPAPAGIHILGGFDPVDAVYVGAEPVVAAYRGTQPIEVP